LNDSMHCLEGKAHKLGDHINTDLIIPATYLTTQDEFELGRHLFAGLEPEFAKKITKGDIIVAGENFGSGSSREHAALAIKGAGISCVVASSFARIFYRNAINIGLPILESPEAAMAVGDGDMVRINLAEGKIEDLTTGQTFQSQRYPDFMQKIIDHGGLVNYLKEENV